MGKQRFLPFRGDSDNTNERWSAYTPVNGGKRGGKFGCIERVLEQRGAQGHLVEIVAYRAMRYRDHDRGLDYLCERFDCAEYASPTEAYEAAKLWMQQQIDSAAGQG